MLPEIATFSDYGGEKQDYSAPEDPTTDRSADEMNPALADVAAGTRTAVRAYVEFRANPPNCDLVVHDAVWGNSIPVAPVLTYNGAGDYTVTFPASITDALGATKVVNLRAGWANVDDLGFTLIATARKISANSFHVAVMDISSGAYADGVNGEFVQLFVM